MSMEMEDDFVGRPIHEVPKVDSGEYCNGKKKLKRDGEVVRDDENHVIFGGYCEAEAGKGTDHFGEGRCQHHGGSSTGAPAHNQNAQKHSLTADPHHYHENLDPDQQEWIEDMTHVILDRIRKNHGREPDPLDIVLARRVVIKLDMVAQASDYTADNMIQVIMHDGGSHEEKGALLEEVRRFDNSIMSNLKDLGVLEDPQSKQADSLEQWTEFLESADEDEEIVIDATDESDEGE